MEGASIAVPTQAPAQPPAETTDMALEQDVMAVEGAAQENAGDILGSEALGAEGEMPAGEMPAEAPADPIMSVAMEIFPDRQFQSPDEASQAVMEYVAGVREYETNVKAANKDLLDIFNSNPEIVQLLRFIKAGATFTEALPRIMDVDQLAPVEGEPDWDSWNTAKEERMSQLSQLESSRNEVTENLSLSMQEVEQFAQENSMSADEAAELLTAIDDLLDNISRGKITKDILAKLKKGLFYERDLQQTAEVSEIRGRNEAIEAKIEKEQTPKGDGLPDAKTVAVSTEAQDNPSDPTAMLGRNIDSFVQTKRF